MATKALPGTYYAVLGLEPSATAEAIRAAYKELALTYHPDKNPKGEAAFKAVSTAYETLKDGRKRAAYDADLRTFLAKKPTRSPRRTSATASYFRTPAPFDYDAERKMEDSIMKDAFANFKGGAWGDTAAASSATSSSGSAFRHAASFRAFRQRDNRPASAENEGAEAAAASRTASFRQMAAEQRARDAADESRSAAEARAREAELARRKAETDAIRKQAEEARAKFAAEAAARRDAKRSEELRVAREAALTFESKRDAAVHRASLRASVSAADVKSATNAFIDNMKRWDLLAAAKCLAEPCAVAFDYPFSHTLLGEGTTALHLLAAYAHKKSSSAPDATINELFTRLIADLGPSAELQTDSTGRTILHLAAANGSIRPLERILTYLVAVSPSSARSALQRGDSNGATALDYAASNGNLNIMERLLAAKAPPDGPADKKQRTPLHAAIRFGHATAAQQLIAAGADVNARDVMRWTPLHFAAAQGNLDCIRVLVAARADRSATTPDGETPLDLAKAEKHFDCVAALR